MADVEGVAEEYPPPAKEGAEFDAGFGLGGDGLGEAFFGGAGESVDLVIVGVLRHSGEVVAVRRDVGGVVVVEALDEAVEEAAGVFHLLPKRFLGLPGWRYAVGHHVGAHALSLRQNGACSRNLHAVGKGCRKRSYDDGKKE